MNDLTSDYDEGNKPNTVNDSTTQYATKSKFNYNKSPSSHHMGPLLIYNQISRNHIPSHQRKNIRLHTATI